MLWDICIPVPVCQFGRTHISACIAVLTWCTNPLRSSDHNYQTTRQLQATELFKLSRLVVFCGFSLASGTAGCTWLCVRLARTLCMCSNQNSWQTAATAQFELHNTPVIICVLAWCIRVVQQNLHAPPNCVDMLHKPQHATGALHYACRKA
jgi:hypothetical protein